MGTDDQLEVINVQTGDDVDEIETGRAALGLFEERSGETVTVSTRQFNRGRSPVDELVTHADEVDADLIVTALRRHSRTERILFGSVSQALLKRTTLPVTLVPSRSINPRLDKALPGWT